MTIISKYSGVMFEQEHVVKSVRRFLPANESRKDELVQFYAQQGGLRTIPVKDIVDVR